MRAALTDDMDDDVMTPPPPSTPATPAVTITSGRPEGGPRVATTGAVDAPKSEVDLVMEKLKEAGLPFVDSDDPAGTVTLSNGDKVTLRELNGEDETRCEAFMDHYGVKPDGAGQSTNMRFMALMSIDTINGEQRAVVDRLEFLRIYLNRFKRADIARIVAGYIKYNLTVDGGPFRPQG